LVLYQRCPSIPYLNERIKLMKRRVVILENWADSRVVKQRFEYEIYN
jgi:hypothetical protein